MTTPLTSAENCQYFSYNFQSFRHSSANNILSKTFLVSRSGQHCWCAHQIFLTLFLCWIVPGEQFYLSPSSEIARLESYEKWHWCVCVCKMTMFEEQSANFSIGFSLLNNKSYRKGVILQRMRKKGISAKLPQTLRDFDGLFRKNIKAEFYWKFSFRCASIFWSQVVSQCLMFFRFSVN